MKHAIGLIANAMVGLVLVRLVCAACGVWVPTFDESMALFFTFVLGGCLGLASENMGPS